MKRSFIKNAKERKNIAFFWKEYLPNPGQRFHMKTMVPINPAPARLKYWFLPVDNLESSTGQPFTHIPYNSGKDNLKQHNKYSTVRKCWSYTKKKELYTEEKAKVVAAVWGTKLIQFLASLASLHQPVLKKVMKSSFSSYCSGAIHPIPKIFLVQNS